MSIFRRKPARGVLLREVHGCRTPYRELRDDGGQDPAPSPIQGSTRLRSDYRRSTALHESDGAPASRPRNVVPPPSLPRAAALHESDGAPASRPRNVVPPPSLPRAAALHESHGTPASRPRNVSSPPSPPARRGRSLRISWKPQDLRTQPRTEDCSALTEPDQFQSLTGRSLGMSRSLESRESTDCQFSRRHLVLLDRISDVPFQIRDGPRGNARGLSGRRQSGHSVSDATSIC